MVEKGFDPATTLFAHTFITGELHDVHIYMYYGSRWVNKLC
jgi:hypothetical protein